MSHDTSCAVKKFSWVLYIVGGIGVGYFLWVHQAHLLQYLPFAFLLLCPLMHLFGGHGHGHDHGESCHQKEGTTRTHLT